MFTLFTRQSASLQSAFVAHRYKYCSSIVNGDSEPEKKISHEANITPACFPVCLNKWRSTTTLLFLNLSHILYKGNLFIDDFYIYV